MAPTRLLRKRGLKRRFVATATNHRRGDEFLKCASLFITEPPEKARDTVRAPPKRNFLEVSGRIFFAPSPSIRLPNTSSRQFPLLAIEANIVPTSYYIGSCEAEGVSVEVAKVFQQCLVEVIEAPLPLQLEGMIKEVVELVEASLGKAPKTLRGHRGAYDPTKRRIPTLDAKVLLVIDYPLCFLRA